MHAFLAALVIAAEVSVAGAVPCPTAQQIDAELRRSGEAAALAGLGDSEVTVVGSVMRVVLRDRTGITLGVREVMAPSACAERVSLAAVILVAWAKTWDETALDPAARPAPVPSRPTRELELGLAAGGSADGDARAPAGTLLAVLQVHQALGATLAADLAGTRQVPLGPGAATYAVSRLGLGPVVRAGGGPFWVDAALLAQITRLSVGGKTLMTIRPATLWGTSVEARGRVGVSWGRLVPFVGLSIARALLRERLTLDDTNDSTRLSPWDVRAEVGVSWIFGGHR